jgi:hypothetical protein
MRPLALLIAFSYTSLLAAQPVSKVAFTESKSAVRVFTPYGETTLPVVRVQLEIQTSAGKTERGNMVVVYDPENGHYLWHTAIANYPGDTNSLDAALNSRAEVIYAAPAGLLNFSMPGNLFVQEHLDRADNLDAAERASIDDIERRALVNKLYEFDVKEVPVGRAIPREFSCVYESGQGCMFMAKSIVSVSRQGENWRIVVRNRWDQEIILDSKFNLISTQPVPPPKK